MIPGLPRVASQDKLLPLHNFTKVNLPSGLEELSDLSGAVNDLPMVHTMAFPMVWLGARVSVGRDRKQFVMYK